MDWNLAVESKREPLLGVVLALFAEIGLAEGVSVERLSKPLYRYILRRLRTAESAVRRLIIAAARDIVVEYRPRPAAAPKKQDASSNDKGKADVEGKAKRKRRLLFSLFDPIKRFGRRIKKMRRPEPRIHFFGEPDPRAPILRLFRQPEPPPPPPAPVVEDKVEDDTVDARHLIRRMFAVKDALEDLPRHAMRYATWRDKPYEERHPQRVSAMRPGRPPGFRKRPIHEVDGILNECHWLARNAMPALDTS